MTSTADLELAVGFVTARIAEEAERSSAPLSDEQRLLLKFLPTATSQNWVEFPVLVPRNQNLERVCELSKLAYQHDLQMNSDSHEWEFALSVFTLYKHPMSGLLLWTGVRLRRPKWDRLLLLAAASLPLVGAVILGWNADSSGFRLILTLLACGAVAGLIVFVFLTARKSARRQLTEEIEKYREKSRFATQYRGRR
jgi:hypothetical protein